MPSSTSRSARGVEALIQARLRLDQLLAEVENQEREIKRLEETELPQAFTEDGISELRLPNNGPRATRQVSVVGSFPLAEADPERHRRAVQVWTELGFADTIRTALAASYGPQDRTHALQVYETLRGDNQAGVTIRETVHASTLRAGILARIRRGEPTPVEDLGCTIIRRVRLTTPPRPTRARAGNPNSVNGIEEEDQ